MASALPVPLLDDQIAYILQRNVLRNIAEEYHIDLDDASYKALIFGETSPPSIVQVGSVTLAYKLLSRYAKKLLLTYISVKRAQVASRYFARATLFDHYCAKLHVGLGLERESALALRRLMNRAMDGTPGTLGTRLFRRGLLAAARASVRAPGELVQMLPGRVFRRLLKRGGDEEDIYPIEELDMALEEQLRAQSGFLARVVTAVELQMSVEGNPYLDELVDNFERLWRTGDTALDSIDALNDLFGGPVHDPSL